MHYLRNYLNHTVGFIYKTRDQVTAMNISRTIIMILSNMDAIKVWILL